jgi:hypothetical protein
MDKLRDDLEATKQLLDLEVRSKRLLEKDNKRLAQELEKLRMELCHGGKSSSANAEALAKIEAFAANAANDGTQSDEKLARRNSMAAKRNSVIRLLSESENHDQDEPAMEPTAMEPPVVEEQDEVEEDDNDNEEEDTHNNNLAENSFEDELAEIEEMREEVDEARKLAEEWEAKYKDMQRQMSDLETSRYKKHSLIIDSVPMVSKKASVTSEHEGFDYNFDANLWISMLNYFQTMTMTTATTPGC